MLCAALAATALCAAGPAKAASSKFAAEVSNFTLVPEIVCSASDVQDNKCTTTNVDWETVLHTTIQTPNQQDLLIGGSLQTGVGTETQVASKNGNKSSSSASATINVRVLIDGQSATQCSGTSCPGGVAYPYQVTYDARSQALSAQLLGLDCTAAQTAPYAVTCSSPEIIDLLIKTTAAHSFNFVAPNLTAGTHTVELQVNIGESAKSDTLDALSKAYAEVGVGSLTVQQVKATNNPDGITFYIPPS